MRTIEQRLDDFAADQTDRKASELIREAASFIRAYTIDPDAPVEDPDTYLDPHDLLLDQGITRLQLLAFLRGDESVQWNGASRSQFTQWVHYRAHQIDRIHTPDGLWVQLVFTDHTGTGASTHEWASVTDSVAVLRDIDLIIDAAIAHHGPDGVA